MNIQEWAIGLWGSVEDNRDNARPFYLCIDEYALARIAAEMSPEMDSPADAEQDFLLSCFSRMDVFADRVLIDKSGFEVQSNGRSLAICFAAQQVLAAERMISDDDAGSDAYYARYRQILGLDPKGLGTPLRYIQFAKIWETFRIELLSLANASGSVITFQQGTGKNKYRALPMSQALLDQESLVIIHERIPNIGKRSDEDLIHRVRRISRHLSRKGQDKVYLDIMVPALLNQIRSFTRGVTAHPRGPSSGKLSIADPSLFFVYIEDDGWDDVYRLGIREADGAADETLKQLPEKLKSYFDRHSMLPFKEGLVSDFDGMLFDEATIGDAALVVLTEQTALSDDTRFKWRGLFYETDCCSLPDGYRMLLRDPSIQWTPAAAEAGQGEGPHGIDLSGGILVDQLRRTFLAGYTPTQIYIEGTQLSDNELITVNGEKTLVASFLRELRAEASTCDYRVTFKAHHITLGVGVKREVDQLYDVGYPIDNGVCAPVATDASTRDALQHLEISADTALSAAFTRRLKRGELVKHLSIPSEQWVQTSSDIVETVAAVVEHELSGTVLSQNFIIQLRRNRAVPITLLLVVRQVHDEVA